MTELKYDKAYDAVLNKWVKPSEVHPADRYDKPRFFSEEKFNGKGAEGEILTYRKESIEIPYKRKDLHVDKASYTRQACFASFCKNTAENRKELKEKSSHQESKVHLLAKQIAKEIEYITLPSFEVNLMGESCKIFRGHPVKVKYKGAEKQDSQSKRIPDLIFETEYLGKKEELYVEIFYKHRVDQQKKEEFKRLAKNCIEIDISDLRCDLNMDDKALRDKIEYAIVNSGYWISNGFQEWFNRFFIHKYILDINKSNYLRNTTIHNGDKITLENRLYLFKDGLPMVNGEEICDASPYDTTNIGTCKTCRNCIEISNYRSKDTNKIHCYCDMTKRGLARLSKAKFIEKLTDLAIEDYKEV
jgi:hypothetical protein